MKNSEKFFENRDCKYYPCHNGMDELNCLFCYCPLYRLDHCPGNPSYMEAGGRTIKVCSECTFPHKAKNYEMIMDILKNS